MSVPILYSPTETNFDYNGIGFLSDCVSCEVIENSEGNYELDIVYITDGLHFKDIIQRSIIKVVVDEDKEPQRFRVDHISKEMNNMAFIRASHISYDLSGVPVSPFSADTAKEALKGLKNNAATEFLFDVWTDKEEEGEFKNPVPNSVRACLGGIDGNILKTYGGEYEFDNYTVKLYNERGKDRGFYIRYGKNLTDLKQEEKCANVYTGVYPYWVDSENGSTFELSQRIVNAPGTYDFVKIKTVDMTQFFKEKPTEQELLEVTENYIAENKIGIPEVSITVSFEQLSKSEEYKGLKYLEKIGLYDTVHVEFPKMGVSATATVVETVRDVLKDRFSSVVIGNAVKNISDVIVRQSKEIYHIKANI